MPAIFAFPILCKFRVSHRWVVGLGEFYFVRSMYDNKYMSQIVGRRNKSTLRTNFFSSSAVKEIFSGGLSIMTCSTLTSSKSSLPAGWELVSVVMLNILGRPISNVAECPLKKWLDRKFGTQDDLLQMLEHRLFF